MRIKQYEMGVVHTVDEVLSTEKTVADGVYIEFTRTADIRQFLENCELASNSDTEIMVKKYGHAFIFTKSSRATNVEPVVDDNGVLSVKSDSDNPLELSARVTCGVLDTVKELFFGTYDITSYETLEIDVEFNKQLFGILLRETVEHHQVFPGYWKPQEGDVLVPVLWSKNGHRVFTIPTQGWTRISVPAFLPKRLFDEEKTISFSATI